MIRLRAAALAMLFVLTSACTTTYTWRHESLERPPRGTLEPAPYPTTEGSRWAHLFVFGLIGRSSVDVRDLCPGPVARRLRSGITVPTVLVSVLTLGIYTPLEHRFTCLILPPELLAPPPVVLEETAPLETLEGDDALDRDVFDRDEPALREVPSPPADELETDELETDELETDELETDEQKLPGDEPTSDEPTSDEPTGEKLRPPSPHPADGPQ